MRIPRIILGRPLLCALALLGVAIAGALLRPTTASTVIAAQADADNAPVDASPAEEKSPPAAGVTLTLYPAGKDSEASAHDSRSARLMSLYVVGGQPPSPFVPAGPFVAVFQGNVSLRLRDSFAFKLEGRGKATLTVNDEPLMTVDDLSKSAESEEIRLNKGENRLALKYESPADGDASVRLLWRNRDDLFFEPIAPQSLTHDAAAKAGTKGTRLREGRQLLADLRCTKCHALDQPERLAGGMPELGYDGPDLSDVGGRLNQEWMALWIRNPQSFRPTAHMPRVFGEAGHGMDQGESNDIAAYLATLDKPAEDIRGKLKDVTTIKSGGRLFAEMNCIVCHEPPAGEVVKGEAKVATDADDDAPAITPPVDKPQPRIPLSNVDLKFKPAALVQFLLKPSAHYGSIPMPNFRFSQAEAESLAAFLLVERAKTFAASAQEGDAVRGKQLVASSGCVNCHKIGDQKSTLKAPPLASFTKDSWTKGCVLPAPVQQRASQGGGPRKGEPITPWYPLTDDQRQALAAVVAEGLPSLSQDTPAEFAERQIKSMNCAGCHARDGHESLLATIYDAEHRAFEKKYPHAKVEQEGVYAPDQRAPLMTWFGQKLNPEWATNFIAGEIRYEPRPYLYARMPSFSIRAKGLAEGLAAQHGVGPESADLPKPDAELAKIGSQLMGRTANASLGCVQCHAVGKQPAFAPFEAPAVNFAYTRDRIRHDYYHLWVHNPQKLDPNTKMPAFEGSDGKTPLTTILEGDARKQFEAIWQYLLAGDQIAPPTE